uniref:Uncharacterized protein n=1 Tax=Peromyscus maniculatus bairdii TaxID=230844 RepID=A0A8C8W615_PERMB
MNVASPAQVFGPATAAHAVPNPDPVTMFWDIKCQLKVGENLFFLPLESWNQFAMVVHENIYTQRGHGNSALVLSTPWGPTSGLLVAYQQPETAQHRAMPRLGRNKRRTESSLSAVALVRGGLGTGCCLGCLLTSGAS